MAEQVKLGDIIGAGSYGKVRRYGTDKVVKTEQLQNLAITSSAINELTALSSIDHPNVIKLYGFYFEENTINLILPYYEHESLNRLDFRASSPEWKLWIIRDILKGYTAISDHGFVHRDLKPGNILIEPGAKAVIADFGLAYWIGLRCTQCSDEVVTPLYRAPELFFGVPSYESSVDIWSIGMIILELYTGFTFIGPNELISVFGQPNVGELAYFESLPDFRGIKSTGVLSLVDLVERGTIPTNIADIVRKICRYIPKERPSAREILSYSLFDGVRESEPIMFSLDMNARLDPRHVPSYSNLVSLDLDREGVLEYFDISKRRVNTAVVFSSLIENTRVFESAVYMADYYVEAVSSDKSKLVLVFLAAWVISNEMLNEASNLDSDEIACIFWPKLDTDTMKKLGIPTDLNELRKELTVLVRNMITLLQKKELLNVVTPSLLLQYLLRALKIRQIPLVQFIIKLLLIDGWGTVYTADKLMFASVYYVMLVMEDSMYTDLLSVSRYTEAELESIIPKITTRQSGDAKDYRLLKESMFYKENLSVLEKLFPTKSGV